MTKARTIANGVYSLDIANFLVGTPSASQMIMRFVANRAFTLPAGMPGSVGEVDTAPTAACVFDIQKNQVSVGSMNFAMSAGVATFTMATDTAFVVGDELELLAPADPFGLVKPVWNFAGLRS